MANWYVYSGAGGSASGADWANAKLTLAAAITSSSAGDTFYVAHDHAETQASLLVLTFKGTAISPDKIYCVNRAGSVPPVPADLQTGATVTTTGANIITLQGHFYCYGMTFNCGTGSSAVNLSLGGAAGQQQIFDRCAFNLVTTNIDSTIVVAGSASRTIWNDTTVSFGSASQDISIVGPLWWRNKPGSAAIAGANIGSPLITHNSGHGDVLLEGLDLSAYGAAKQIFNPTGIGTYRALNCKLGASVIESSTPTAPPHGGVFIEACHNTTNGMRNSVYRYQGTLTTETTIKRTAGASDGAIGYCWKIITTSNNERTHPFASLDGVLYNDAIGSPKTLTVHTLTNNVTLTDAEIWLEVEYLGSSAAPVASFINDGAATMISTPANQASDSGEAWTTTGLGTPLKQKLEVTFTPQMAGAIRWRVWVGKIGATLYVCPKADLS